MKPEIEATKHVGLGQTDKPAAFLFHLHKYEIDSAGILVRRALVTNIQCLTDAMYVSVHNLTAVMDDVEMLNHQIKSLLFIEYQRIIFIQQTLFRFLSFMCRLTV